MAQAAWPTRVYTVPAIIIVEKINNYLRETVITTVITPQYTMVVTNRKLPIRRYYDPTIIVAGMVGVQVVDFRMQNVIGCLCSAY